jgi:hypothetical protein
MSFYWVNEGESAATFCHQVTAWVPDIFLQLLFSEKSRNC